MKPDIMHQSWYNKLKHKFEDGTLTKIRQEIGKAPFSPENPKHIFRAFDLNPKDIKVVICALSPYMDHNAVGYAFATHQNTKYDKYPFSLKVIADAIANENQIEDIDNYLCSDLVMWQMQGVMLLNVALTTIQGDSNSHVELWKPFMIEVFKALNELDKGLIFYFFGSKSYEYAKYLNGSHYIFKSVHPASIYHNKDMVFDSHFKEVADKYKELYGTTLDWVLPF